MTELTNPIVDQELSGLLVQNSRYFSETGLNTVLSAYQQSTVVEPAVTVKRFLVDVPEYMETAASVSIIPEQAQDLLVHLLNAKRNNFDARVPLPLLTNALQQSADRGEMLTVSELESIKTLIATSGRKYAMGQSLYAFGITRRIGLSIEQSTSLLLELLEDKGPAPQEIMSSFCKASGTLAIAKVSPELVVRTFKTLGSTKNPHLKPEIYKIFAAVITFACPENGISPQELLEVYFSRNQKEDLEDFLADYLKDSKQQPVPLGLNDVEIITADVDKYFITKPGNLEHAALPYRTSLGLNEGVRDLEHLATIQPSGWGDIVSEGFWTFDPDTNEWYSLGGETNVQRGHITHRAVPYDVSELSATPFLFHIHPEATEVMITPDFRNTPLEPFKQYFTKIISSLPSREDYMTTAEYIRNARNQVHTRAFIVHSLGTTEFIFPNDTERIEEMANRLTDLRDQIVLAFDWNSLKITNFSGSNFIVISQLITKLNASLPEGFEIKLHAPGVDLEQETGIKQMITEDII